MSEKSKRGQWFYSNGRYRRVGDICYVSKEDDVVMCQGTLIDGKELDSTTVNCDECCFKKERELSIHARVKELLASLPPLPLKEKSEKISEKMSKKSENCSLCHKKFNWYWRTRCGDTIPEKVLPKINRDHPGWNIENINVYENVCFFCFRDIKERYFPPQPLKSDDYKFHEPPERNYPYPDNKGGNSWDTP